MKYFNANEAAQYLGLCRNRVLYLLHSGRLPGVKTGNRWLISEKTLDHWVDKETYNQTHKRVNAR